MHDDDEFICPMAWKWTEIYNALHVAWSEGHADDVPEPPHLLAPNSTDDARHQRWLETVEWAETHGFTEKIPVMDEQDKYYRD